MSVTTDWGSLVWRCECGERAWLHHEHCAVCGRERPVPKQEPPGRVPLAPELDPA